jgi:hypothetical protein
VGSIGCTGSTVGTGLGSISVGVGKGSWVCVGIGVGSGVGSGLAIVRDGSGDDKGVGSVVMVWLGDGVNVGTIPA